MIDPGLSPTFNSLTTASTSAGHAYEDDAAALTDFADGLHLGCTAPNKIVDRRAVAMANDGERIALFDDVFRNAVAHQAKPDKADGFVCHDFLMAM